MALAAAVGDLDHDGNVDLVIANSTGYEYPQPAPGTLNVLLGRGDGTFAAPVPFDSGYHPSALAIADLDGDGRLDVVFTDAEIEAPSLRVMLGNGDGTLKVADVYPLGAPSDSLVVADLNGDGVPDVAVAVHGDPPVALFLGKGDGTLDAPVGHGAGGDAFTIAANDFDGDGMLDLAYVTAKGVGVLLGDGDGTFSRATLSPRSFLTGFAASDLDGDGRVDLAAATTTGLDLLLGNGDGTFRAGASYDVALAPSDVSVGDINGDGKPDLVVMNTATGTTTSIPSVVVALGRCDGTFELAVNYPPTGYSNAYAYSTQSRSATSTATATRTS